MLEQDIGTLITYSLSRISRLAEFSQFQEEQQKAINILFQNNDISVSLPTGYGKSSIHVSSSAIDRSALLSRRNRSLYLLCRPPIVKALTEDQVYYLNVLVPRGLSA